ncbi:hypothetical protein ACFYOV_15600 [Streptomyces sp. NPDC005931]|uniref:hypothetical protein n=1 Tax=Streptomyces sp. NPDC005931 TaxID=3364737 RepID=UPI0036D0A2BA
MLHRKLRSAATVLLASAPLFAAVPAQAAQAAPQQAFPCAVAIQKISNEVTSTITLTVVCDVTRTVTASITVNGAELVSLERTVQAGVSESLTVTTPRVPQVCATLETDGESTTVCTP